MRFLAQRWDLSQFCQLLTCYSGGWALKFLTTALINLKKYSSLAQLGQMAGGKHYATTIWGIKTVEEVLEMNSQADRRLRWFEIALSEIENRLHITIKH